MPPLKAVLLSCVLSITVVFCLAGNAMAGTITSVHADVVMNPTSPNQVTVTSSFAQDAPTEYVQIATFMMSKWDSTCSSGGYPWPEGTPNGVVEDSNFTSTMSATVSDFVTNFVANPKDEPVCIGTVAWTANQVVLDAHPVYYNKPYMQQAVESETSSSIKLEFDVTPNNLATSYELSWFKLDASASCNSPDEADVDNAVNTPTATISSNLGEVHRETIEITGLEKESEYCIAYHAQNAAGSEESIFGSYYTLGNAPVLANLSADAATSSMDFSVDVTPGITFSETGLAIWYFEKSGATCVDPGPPDRKMKEIYYDGGGMGLRGFDPIKVEDTITGLAAGKSYCVAAYASNAYGETGPTSWVTAITVSKTNASSDGFYTQSTPDPDFPVALRGTLHDNGAYGDTGDDSSFTYAIFENTPERCNEDDYAGGDETLGGGGDFSGEAALDVGLANLQVGQAYCAAVHIESAWGDAFDGDSYFAFFGGTAPTVSDVTASADHTTINVAGNVDPGYQDAMYGITSRLLADGESCGDSVFENDVTFEFLSVFAIGLTGPQAVVGAIEHAEPNSRYCVRLLSQGGLGYDDSNDILVTTGNELDESTPSTPTGLSSSAITPTSATLSWTASTDDVGVTGYKVYADGSLFGTTASTSKSVVLTCEVTTHFKVSATDLDNESPKSAEFDITGATCPDTTPPTTPSGLVASNVTQTSATLSWTASTDAVGVTRYDVIDGDIGVIGSTATPSKSVALTCGNTSIFHVKAFDAAGNPSYKSDTLEITGAACVLPPASGGGAPRTCVAPISPQKALLKRGKKKIRVSITGKIAADGQSVVITGKGKGTKITFKVAGKKVTGKNGAITVTGNPAAVTVSFKAGSKIKTIKISTKTVAC
jgi:hypothetical protein